VTRLLANSSSFVTPFSRFKSQPSGNTGGQQDTLKQDCHVTVQYGESMQRVKL